MGGEKRGGGGGGWEVWRGWGGGEGGGGWWRRRCREGVEKMGRRGEGVRGGGVGEKEVGWVGWKRDGMEEGMGEGKREEGG